MTLVNRKLIKLNNRGVRNVTTFGSVSGGSFTFIKKLTASSSATLDFVDGTSDVVLDNTYKEYLFTFNNLHPSADDPNLTFQANAAGGSGYDETMTTTAYQAYNREDGGGQGLGYSTGGDQAQGTAFQSIGPIISNENDSCSAGYLRLFNPSSTTFVKHFIAATMQFDVHPTAVYPTRQDTAGYFNTTSAIDEIQFKMSSGNIDAGDICLYGIK